MLSAKPWKWDGVARFLLSVFVCVYAGSLAVSAFQHTGGTGVAAFRFYAMLAAAWVCLAGALVVLRQPWRLETFMRQFGLLLVFFYAGLFLGAWAARMAGPPSASVRQLIIGALSFQGAALVLGHRFLREYRVSWREAFGLTNRWQHAMLIGLIAACLFLPIGWGLQWLSALVMSHLPWPQLKPVEQETVLTLQTATGWEARAVLGVITILLAPIAEEMVFRGILYPWIKQAGFPRLALWGTALVFAAIHFNGVSFLPLTLLALILAMLYERTDNLLAPVTAHGLFNALNFTMLYLVQDQVSRLR